jgi:hypothetical protein
MDSHYMHVHSNNKPFCCVYCGKEFTMVARLSSHEKKHTEFPVVQCPSCNGHVAYFGLHIHRQSCEGEKNDDRLLCRYCLLAFDTAEIPYLQQYLIWHSLTKETELSGSTTNPTQVKAIGAQRPSHHSIIAFYTDPTHEPYNDQPRRTINKELYLSDWEHHIIVYELSTLKIGDIHEK